LDYVHFWNVMLRNVVSYFHFPPAHVTNYLSQTASRLISRSAPMFLGTRIFNTKSTAASYAYSYGRRFPFPKPPRRQFAHHGRRDQSPQCEDPLQQVHGLLLLDPYVLPDSACTLFAPSRIREAHAQEDLGTIADSREPYRKTQWADLGADFWGPASNFGIPIAAIADMSKDPEM
jgi:hypothetical protein